ncbi:MAG: hypothetical protein ACU836_05545 [Gammaproteobacteria bacterium]
MNATLLKYQLTACGVLGTVILLEWGVGTISQHQLQDTLDENIRADYRADPLPSLSHPRQSADSFAAITERPLFIEGRRPIPEEEQESTEVAADTGKLEDWDLIGIYNKDNKKLALFRHQKEAKKFLKIYEQQTISGWQLEQIENDRVLLQLGEQQKTVMLRKPREQSKMPVPARPPVPQTPARPNALPNHNPSENNNDR